MTSVLAQFAPLLGVAAVAVAVLVFAATRSVAAALPVLLDLLLAAGLLKLSADTTWAALGSAALIVAIRKVATFGMQRSRSPAHAHARSA